MENGVPDDLRPEYDEATFRQMIKSGVRGKYTGKYRAGTNLVKLAPADEPPVKTSLRRR